MSVSGSLVRSLPRGKIGIGKVRALDSIGISASITLRTHRSKSRRKKSVKKDQKEEKEDQTVVTGAEFSIAVLEREDKQRYGWGKFTPDWLQICRHERFLLVAVALVAVTQSFLINGVMPASIPPLRRRFHFTTLDIGLMRMMFDIGMVVTFLPVMYKNARGIHRARWLGISCMVMAVGALICVVPHLLAGRYNFEPLIDSNRYCTDSDSTAANVTKKALRECGDVDLHNYKYIFMVGLFVCGIGAAPYYTIGIAYLDENVSVGTSVLYTGILHVCLLVGVAIGSIMTGLMLAVYVDVGRNLQGIKVPDPNGDDWVGAWWLAVLFAAALSMLAAGAMCGFPKRLPGAATTHAHEAMETGPLTEESLPSTEIERGIWKSVKACLTNVTYVGLITEQCSYSAAVTSFVVFMPLYFRTIYEIPAKEAAILGGAFVVMSAVIGSICGTVCQRLLNFGPKANLRFSLGTAIATLFFLFVFFTECSQAEIGGVTVRYLNHGRGNVVLKDECNKHCNCSRDYFNPVCYTGPEEKQRLYFSTCFAGCKENDPSNCSCVPGKDGRGGGAVVENRCKRQCSKSRLYAFLVGLAWCAVTIYARINPIQQCLLRCIPFNDRVVGLTMSALAARLIGAVPAPVMLGEILRRSCAAWRTICDIEIYCVWHYKQRLSRGVVSVGFILTAVGVTGLSLANWYYNPSQRLTQSRTRTPTYSVSRKRSVSLDAKTPPLTPRE